MTASVRIAGLLIFVTIAICLSLVLSDSQKIDVQKYQSFPQISTQIETITSEDILGINTVNTYGSHQENTAYLQVCKIFIDQLGNIVEDDFNIHADFEIELYKYSRSKPPEFPINRGKVWKKVSINSPFQIRNDVIGNDRSDDADCNQVITIKIRRGEDLYISYAPEVIKSDGGFAWQTAVYYDYYGVNPADLNVFDKYNNQLWDEIIGNEDQANSSADGEIQLLPNTIAKVLIVNQTDFTPLTPTPRATRITPSPTMSPTLRPTKTPPVIEHTVRPTPTDLTRLSPTPTVETTIERTKVPQVTPTPTRIKEEIILTTPVVSIMAEIKPVSVKYQNFSTSENCVNQTLTINSMIISSEKIVAIEYSIDGGINWYPYNLKKAKRTVELKQVIPNPRRQVIAIQFRTQLITSQIINSQNYSFHSQCEGKIVILGNYFQNGFNHAVLDKQGDVIYNSQLPIKVYAETLGPVKQLDLLLAGSRQNLRSELNYISLPMQYDFATKVWSTLIPKELLDQELTYSALRSGELIKDIPVIINLEYITQVASKKISPLEVFDYQLYFFTGKFWRKLDYAAEYKTQMPTNAYAKFNLNPGKYYFKVDSNFNYSTYSKQFELDEPAVVKVNTVAKDTTDLQTRLAALFKSLDVEIYSKSKPPKTSNIERLTTNNAPKLAQFIKTINFDPQQKIYFIYFDRWNPHFVEELNYYQSINQQLIQNSRGKIVILLDPQSAVQFKKQSKISQLTLDYIEVTDNEFLNTDLHYQPEIIVFEPLSSREIARIQSNYNFEELINKFNY